ncbi:GNAT family N-acetyltransferase [Chitinophaga sp. LS1]|uniref:GNAT family N-acetyltransferase n=1 Tax=Chitinophaga sp. LS1 TaxID=3051176 RepID=UPI002AAA88CE|nr:GNAT family N-acetyltransferase [Chitinophaga sp. LS1]WPV64474.1 GNAT family N-acetyltransferase [Chitinophaga sp. LS1]
MSFITVSIYDNTRWDRYIRNAHTFDFNHTWYYHSTFPGEPVLLVYEERDDYIALPVVMNSSTEGIRYISGFAGPLASRNFAVLDNGVQERFEIAFLQYLKEQQISESSILLHPLIHAAFKPLRTGRLQQHADSLLIDLSLSPGMQEANYGENFGNNVSLLRRKGYTVRQATSIHDVDTFADIYYRNSMHLQSGSAHFDKAWFRQILRPSGFESTLLLACQGTQVAAGVLLTFCNDMMQLHLAATHEQYLQHAPLHLLLAEAGGLGKTAGMQYFHLGGMGRKADVLFASKAITSETYPGFKTWHVPVQQIQNSLKNYRQQLSIAV